MCVLCLKVIDLVEKKSNGKCNTMVWSGNLKDNNKYCSISKYELINRFKPLSESSRFDNSESFWSDDTSRISNIKKSNFKETIGNNNTRKEKNKDKKSK